MNYPLCTSSKNYKLLIVSSPCRPNIFSDCMALIPKSILEPSYEQLPLCGLRCLASWHVKLRSTTADERLPTLPSAPWPRTWIGKGRPCPGRASPSELSRSSPRRGKIVSIAVVKQPSSTAIYRHLSSSFLTHISGQDWEP